jgi:Protein of unknown function (DUF3489)
VEVIAMMKRAKGVTLAQIREATGWQAHTVRGFVSILGSKGGEKIESSRTYGQKPCVNRPLQRPVYGNAGCGQIPGNVGHLNGNRVRALPARPRSVSHWDTTR